MAYSSNPEPLQAQGAKRGYLPPQNDAERFLLRRVADLCNAAQCRCAPQYSGFLSDREQVLAQAALNRAGCTDARFYGGFEGAERKVLCIEPPDAWQEEPVAYLHFTVNSKVEQKLPTHRDYLGAILGLGLDRACLGDLLQDTEHKNEFYAVVLAEKADFIAAELMSAGSTPVVTQVCEALPESALRAAEHPIQEATVSSLRADAVLAAMMHTSRGRATEYISAGRVEINHLALHTAGEPVYAGDLFTVRGQGRYRLQAIGGKSRKDRIFISFYQYL